MIFRREPRTALIVVANPDGTVDRLRVPGNEAKVRAVMDSHGDRVLAAHDGAGRDLCPQGAPSLAPQAGQRVNAPQPYPYDTFATAEPSVDRKVTCSGVEPPVVTPSAVGQSSADPVANAQTHTYGITTDDGYGTAWDLRLPDGTTGMASAKHVLVGDTKNPPIAATPDSDFAVARGDGVQGGLELASRDAEPGDQVAIVTVQQGPLPATVTGTEVVKPEGGGGESFDTTTVDRPVIPGDSGSSVIQMEPESPDYGKVVGTVSCTDEEETALVPASTMREVVGTSAAETSPKAPGAALHDLFAGEHCYGHNAALKAPVGSTMAPVAAPPLEDSAVPVYTHAGPASGAVIAPDKVLTADHVAKIAGAPDAIVADESRDVAVVEQDTNGAAPLPLATQSPAVGSPVTIHSHRVGGTLHANVIATGDEITLDQPVPDGTSGAPIEQNGQIVGMVTHGIDEEGICSGPSAPAIRESIVPEPERTAGVPIPGAPIPVDAAEPAGNAAHYPEPS